MPNPVNITSITPPRVPLTDERTGLISREWYRFFLNLFQLTGNGSNQISLTDLQYGPSPLRVEDIPGPPDDVAPAPATSEVSAGLNDVRQELQTLPSPATAEVTDSLNDVRQELQTLPRDEIGTMAALQQADLPWVTFNTSGAGVPPTVGTVAWDGGTTLNVQATANVLMRVGEAEYVYAKASSAITKGQLCYHTGAVGASGVITVAPTPLALADPNQIVGVAAETLALNAFGLIQISGDLRGFNTTGSSVGEVWADGDALYYNPAFVGSMTKNKPSAPNQKSYIGEVTNAGAGSSGSMHIRIVPGTILGGTDSNVQITGVADKDLLQYDSTAGYWKNVPATTVGVTSFSTGTTGFTPSTATTGAVTLAGTLKPSNGGTGVTTTPTNGQLLIGNGTNYTVANLTAGSGVTITNSAGGISISATGTGGTVTSVSVASANGFAGSVANATTTPAITISTSITGLLYGNGTAIAAATVSSPLSYSAGTLSIPVATSSANGYLSSTDWTTFNNKQSTSAPATYTANFSVAATDVWIINNKSGSSCTVTLPAAASYTGRVLHFQNYQAQTLVSASSNVVPLAGGAAGTAILSAVAGANATLVSDGTNWIMTQYTSNNSLLLE
jgi:hypothetical protein